MNNWLHVNEVTQGPFPQSKSWLPAWRDCWFSTFRARCLLWRRAFVDWLLINFPIWRTIRPRGWGVWSWENSALHHETSSNHRWTFIGSEWPNRPTDLHWESDSGITVCEDDEGFVISMECAWITHPILATDLKTCSKLDQLVLLDSHLCLYMQVCFVRTLGLKGPGWMKEYPCVSWCEQQHRPITGLVPWHSPLIVSQQAWMHAAPWPKRGWSKSSWNSHSCFHIIWVMLPYHFIVRSS